MKLTHIVAGTALLLSGFAAGSVAVGLSASATSNSITFYACSVKTTGVLSATSTKAPTCAKTATLVTWNSVGPQGIKGAPGTNGAKGDTGAPGPSLSGIQFYEGYVIMPRAHLNGADLETADLRAVDLSEAYLRGANLSFANLPGANLYQADLTGATCPNGIVYGQSGADC
ncbi:MAG: pentapeptide repeat-containing protein [Actinomycetes bacterium]